MQAPDFPFAAQYALVQDARAVLLAYCDELPVATLQTPVPAFAGRSMLELLVHVAATYDRWLGQVGLGRAAAVPAPAALPDLPALRRLFAAVDALVADFGQASAGRWLQAAPRAVPGRAGLLAFSPLQLFTHAVTHEFHHKGQVLTMSRLLGHQPPDTDVIRT